METDNQIRIILIDDQAIVRAALKALLNGVARSSVPPFHFCPLLFLQRSSFLKHNTPIFW